MMFKVITGWFPYIHASATSRCYVLWGREPSQSWGTIWYHIRNAKKEGKKLIVVDPRHTQSASLADIHLQLRPGTDCALALAMINVIIDDNLYDKEFVTHYCHGFDQLRQRVQQYAPEKVSEITWIPADKIREAARMYATNKPGAIIDGMGVEHLENNAEYIHARLALAAIVGNISVPGGEALYGPHPKAISVNEIELVDMLPGEQRQKVLGADRFKVSTSTGYDLIQENLIRVWGKRGGRSMAECAANAPLVYRSIITGEPYQVKALITLNSNPMVTQANTKLVYKALKNLDLYVVVDFVMTPSAELADYVLAGACWMERPCIFDGGNNANYLFGGEQALPTMVADEYDHRDDYQFWRELGIRLGQKEYWWESMEDVFDYRLKPMELTFAEFMAKGGIDRPPVDFDFYKTKGFATPSGKVELYSTILEKLGYDPLPAYREPAESPISQPSLAEKYPYILITGSRHQPFFHSEFRHVYSLRKRHHDPLVQIHPQTARDLQIENGDWVWIETIRGRVRQRCQYYDGLQPAVVNAQHGWWFPELPGEEPWLHGVWESNINVCTNDDPEVCNPLLGSWPLRTFLCKIHK
ncbi:molybdopterin-dependent oxidoreductase [Chloroflexota bacterium]